ncbi:hypothetical protein [Sinosporangium siamense]|uniref:Uncharacterized protein n=1 Tax=Sinosporangium siamense TaxID=1367973 RepID=A0A919RDS6_9ACTN|nr:hypothetical protein [Sinosporangium siamense]GII92050.1 hypothetical protein Ssi02_22810 [Sinosporangium siamense]
MRFARRAIATGLSAAALPAAAPTGASADAAGSTSCVGQEGGLCARALSRGGYQAAYRRETRPAPSRVKG